MGGQRMEPERYETVVVGGGQAGLATGYHLARLGRPFVILDAGQRVGDAWRARWDSLRLFTPARYSGLPGMGFPAAAWHYPTKDEVAEYLETYAARFQLPVRAGVRVDGLTRQGDRYLVTAGERRFEAANVVVASGAYHLPLVPSFAAELDPGILQLHSSGYRRPAQLQEGGVLVVGAANSGAEIAVELSGAHRIWLSGRHPGSEPTRAGSRLDRLLTPPFWFFISQVLTVDTPIGRKLRPKLMGAGTPLARVRRRDIAAAGIERVPRTAGARDGLPVLEDGRALEVANVVWCTGYRPDFSWIDLPVQGDDGQPRHDRGVVAGQPGLYFVGLFFQTAVSSALVGGVGRDAEQIVARIAARKPAKVDASA
ncbi:MAG TPA: NAD(P)/FAD-dependent oxidoreductase [Actinomycetota bacterium]|nr:NAD(P)/FAD-dependent oxidoreductase [Actinomycetota bacterium]